uniref:CD99 antigen-like protein 2 n=1 Tax=Apteryx owenii TaxID=8824 RepID=A0A8B9QM76_APTOW
MTTWPGWWMAATAPTRRRVLVAARRATARQVGGAGLGQRLGHGGPAPIQGAGARTHSPLPFPSLPSLAGSMAETGTIAGVASALAMALIGAVSSYISYQQKKFCFSIQQGLNAEYVKGENMEAVVSEEPQVKYSVLEKQSAEPPKQDSAKL